MSLQAKAISLLGLLLLTACGFQPVYGKKSALAENSPIPAGISISVTGTTDSHLAQQFQNNLQDLINPYGEHNKPTTYLLQTNIAESNSAIGVARDGTAARYNLVLVSNYTLTRLSDNKVVNTGIVRNMTSYNNPANLYFSTYVAEQDARKRGITELAEMYRQRLAAFSEYAPPAKPSEPDTTYENCPKVN